MSFRRFRQDVALFFAIVVILFIEALKWPFKRKKG